MTLSDLVRVLNGDQYIYVWFSDDIIGRGTVNTLFKRDELIALLKYKVDRVYAYKNQLHIHTDFK